MDGGVRMVELSIKYAKTTDGVNIAYAQLGDGVPLVYAPGAYGLGVHYYSEMTFSRGNVDSLVANGFRVIRYDSRGTGSSDRDNHDFSLNAAILDLEAVVERIGLDRFVLLGHFSSAQATIAFAVKNPDRVSHLILRDPTPSTLRAAQVAAFPSFGIIHAMLPLAAENWELVSLNASVLAFGFTDLDMAKEYSASIRSGITAEAWVAQQQAALDIDVSPLLESVAVPTLVILDKGFPGRSSVADNWTKHVKRVAATIPDARLETTGDVAGAVAAFVGVSKDSSLLAEPARGANAALQTILFTDVVGHTEMMSRLGDERGRDVLREHERITREVLRANGGTEVKTMGDGFMASFGSVTKAVECAIALQRAFADREGEPLNVRVGLNAGEPIEEDGDLFGATVILASRIAAKADGGEILVADTVRGLSSGKGFLFADRGEFVAKGFEEPVRVYEVGWRG
ncbi:MAG: adenylate/guanylate cyclase domain-containing protein [Chloroflexota bacterium]